MSGTTFVVSHWVYGVHYPKMSLFPYYRLAVSGDSASNKTGKKQTKNPYLLTADTIEVGVRQQANTLWKYSSDENKDCGEKQCPEGTWDLGRSGRVLL